MGVVGVFLLVDLIIVGAMVVVVVAGV